MISSRASSATVGRERAHTHHPYSSSDEESGSEDSREVSPEQVPDCLLEDPYAESKNFAKRLIIAVDFGTTYSAVSYVALEQGESERYLDLDRIRSIQNFPDDWNYGDSSDRMRCEVPTEVIYPLNRKFREQEIEGNTMRKEGHAQEHMAFEGNRPPVHDYHDAQASGFDWGSNEGLQVFGQTDSEEDDRMSVDDESTSFRWGYGVHEAWRLQATHADPNNQALSRFKLLLDDSATTLHIRTQLGRTLGDLKRRKIIADHRHVIADFLTCLLRHTKSELASAGFDERYRMELVLCVPAIWSQKACRDMQTALAMAMKQARFDGVNLQKDKNSIEDLFIVSEPEAATAYQLAESRERDVAPGDTFVLLDAGGGTVDANTYTVSATTPLRLTREVVPPQGGLYGSSYINEGFRELLHTLLADEIYLEDGDNTINGHIESIMINQFEYRIKRSFDCYKAKGHKRFDVLGLRDNPAKSFKQGCILIPVEKIQALFLRCFEGIASLMENQISQALAAGASVEKVILIGGFAASKSLKKFLEIRLEQFCRSNNCHVTLIRPENCATAVASGAVLRAFNKDKGPRRYARSSYGILRTEHYKDFPEHEGVKPYHDRRDGQAYVAHTVDWVLKLGQEVESVWTCPPFLSTHMFDFWPPTPLVCREVIYVSDSATESHYRLSHEKNRGAEEVGDIVVDFTFLRDQGMITPVDGAFNSSNKKVGKKHWVVKFTIVIKVVDRDLTCYVIYGGKVMQKCRVNIAAAFQPGVK